LRKLVGLIIVLAVLVGLASIADVVVRKGVEATVGERIEARSPGSHAKVHISSFPFLGQLAASGTVPSLQADVTDITDGSLQLARVDLQVDNLKVSRNDLLHGKVRPLSITSGRVVAEVSQSALDSFSHLPLTLGQGTVGVAGVSIPVHITVTGGAVDVALGHGLADLRVPVPDLDILPCVASGQVVPGTLRLSCSFTRLPSLLATTFNL
jgi:hypothetical protein